MKRYFFSGIAACSLAIALSGCSGSGFKKTFGLEANPPDAFAVGTQPPLSLPPELGQLPPPNPGEPRPQQADAAQFVRQGDGGAWHFLGQDAAGFLLAFGGEGGEDAGDTD